MRLMYLSLSQCSYRLLLPWLVICVASLLLAFVLIGLSSLSTIAADAVTLYVDGASGQDSHDCGTSIAPCKTISYTLNAHAVDGDTVLVAQGAYTENITIDISVQLKGGYETGEWTRDIRQFETIINGSAQTNVAGDWDGRLVGTPSVLPDTGDFKMWYDGQDLTGNRAIGLASATNTMTWTKDLANPVLTFDSGSWDASGEHAPFVMKDSGIYKMWYEGGDGNTRNLGYATSPDGVTWTKYASNPVLQAGPEPYDNTAAGHGYVIKESGSYTLYYNAIGDLGPIIAYATSQDGVNWQKQGPSLQMDAGSWDEFALWGPSVLKLNDTYWMWYSAAGSMPPSIGVVTSTNGITWTRFLTGPVLSESEKAIGHSHVVSNAGKLMMWYQDLEAGEINYAYSSNGISWTIGISNPVLTPGQLAAQWGEPVVTINAADVLLDGFTITGGSAQYAGGIAANVSATIRSCTVKENFADGSPHSQGGGAIQAFGSGAVAVVNSQIAGNRVNEGASGIRAGDSTLVLTNTIIAKNQGDFSLHLNNEAEIWNSTIVENSNGILFNPDGKPSAILIVHNSIVFSNSGSIQQPVGDVTVTYSDIDGGWSGTGNLSVAPHFADASNADYRQQAGSVTIDTGTNTDAPDDDFEGDFRPQDGNLDGTAITDMGADEFVPIDSFLPTVLEDMK